MIEHVVVPRMREHQRRSDAAKQIDRLAIRRLVEDDLDVRLVEAVIGGADFGRGRDASRRRTAAISSRDSVVEPQSPAATVAM